MPFHPVIDGDVLPSPPIDRIAAGASADLHVLWSVAAYGLDAESVLPHYRAATRFPAVAEQLARIPEVLEVQVVTGQADLFVRVATASQSQLQPVLLRIFAIPGVARSNTALLLSTALAYRTQPLLEALTRRSGFGGATPAP